MLSFRSFTASALTFRPIIYFKLIFVYMSWALTDIFACCYPVVPTSFWKDYFFFPNALLDTIVEKPVGPIEVDIFLVSCLFFLFCFVLSLSLFLCQNLTVLAMIASWEIWVSRFQPCSFMHLITASEYTKQRLLLSKYRKHRQIYNFRWKFQWSTEQELRKLVRVEQTWTMQPAYPYWHL